MPRAEFVRFARVRQLITPFQATAFRALRPRYANREDALSTAGSLRAGARFNPPGEFGALYLSLNPGTCVEEVTRFSLSSPGAAALSLPLTIIAIEAALSSVLDLSDPAAQLRLEVSIDQLVDPNWQVEQESGRTPFTQGLGRAAFHAEIEGLLVPSAAHAGYTNLVVFADHLLPGSSLTIVNEEQLAASAY